MQPQRPMTIPGFGGFERPHVAEHPVLGVFAHRAGVEDHHIRALGVRRESKPHLGEHALEFFAVAHILLAAIGANKGELLPSGLFKAAGVLVADTLFIGLLLRKRFACHQSLLFLLHAPCSPSHSCAGSEPPQRFPFVIKRPRSRHLKKLIQTLLYGFLSLYREGERYVNS